jgi:hypothetical protein
MKFTPLFVSLSALILTGLVLSCQHVTRVYPQTVANTVPAVHTYTVTKEGWWIMYTNNQREIAEMCGNADEANVIGCARWPDTEPMVYPVKDCFMGIFVGDPDNPVADIVAHERRHCQEGNFHP